METTASTDDTAKDASNWIAVTTAAGKFLCKCMMSKDRILEALEEGTYVVCHEVFDYACPMQAEPMPGGQVQLGKANIASRLDSTLYSMPVHISSRGAMVYFLSDLKESDSAAYKLLLQRAMQSANESAKMRAAKHQNIVTTNQMPTGDVRGLRGH